LSNYSNPGRGGLKYLYNTVTKIGVHIPKGGVGSKDILNTQNEVETTEKAFRNLEEIEIGC
jgi:hypothetical protein